MSKRFYLRGWTDELDEAVETIFNEIPTPYAQTFKNPDGSINTSAVVRYALMTLASDLRRQRKLAGMGNGVTEEKGGKDD